MATARHWAIRFIAVCSLSATQAAPRNSPAAAYIQQLAIDPVTPDVIYSATNGAGLFRRTADSVSWLSISPSDSVTRHYTLKISPQNPARLITGGLESGLWLSNDRGTSWQQIGLAGTTIADVALDPQDSNRVFVLAPDGVYRSNDIRTQKWQHVFDYAGFQRQFRKTTKIDRLWRFGRFQKIAVDPHNPNTVFIGARWEGGYHVSYDAGDTWAHKTISGIYRRTDTILFHPDQPGEVLLGTHHQGLFKSYNHGQSWVPMNRGLSPQIRTPFYGAYLISGLARDPSNPQVLYTGSDYANWKSSNGGLDWQQLGPTLTCEFARAFAVDPKRPNIVYAGANVGVYKSVDGGEHWQAANNGFPPRTITQTLDATVKGKSYHFALVTGTPAVYRRSPGESEWLPLGWLLREPGDSLTFDSGTGTLILHTPARQYRSTDGGLRWDTPEISYAPVRSLPVAAPMPEYRESEVWQIDLEIHGEVFFEDAAVDSMYQQPPYVSLQLLPPGYPCDGSVPVWQGNWERNLKGRVHIPRDALQPGQHYLFYAEVRDFQKNVQAGFAIVQPQIGNTVTLTVAPNTVLPCLQIPTVR